MKMKTRKLAIKTKIMIATSIIITYILVTVAIIFYVNMLRSMNTMGVRQAKVSAQMAVSMLDKDELSQMKAGDEKKESYQEMLSSLRNLQDIGNVAFLYTLTTDQKNVYYGIDTDRTTDQAKIGDLYEDSYENLKDVFMGNEYVENHLSSDEYDHLITVYLPIKDSKNQIIGILGSDYDGEELYHQVEQTQVKIGVFGVIALILSIIILNILIGKFTKGITLVNDKIYDLVHNEGDLTQVLDVHSGDEMEILAANVNELLQYIRSIMLDISDNSNQLNISSNDVVMNVSNAEENVIDVSATMEQMSASMEETTATINQINDAVEDMYERINMISSKALDSEVSLKEESKKAYEIYLSAESDINEVQNLAKIMADNVNTKIEKSRAVQEINILTENIIGITRQTNLLALNASIEAARAGEKGQGFAVVAGEIGKLAEHSAKAASQIHEVSSQVITAVEELASEAERMLTFLEQGAMEGYRRLITTSESYKATVEVVHVGMHNFAEQSNQLEHLADGIKQSVSAVNAASEESTKGITNITERTAELTEYMSEIHNQADMNQDIAEKLSGEVGKFKLN